MSLENNILKLNIADTLIKNNKTKNSILNNIAYMYLLEDQNMYNNKTFIDKYLQLSTDKEQQREVTEIYNSVKNLNIGNKLPSVQLTDVDFNPISIETITANKETVIFFWTSHADSHLKSVHKRVKEFKMKYPEVNFIAINVDDTNENWTKALKNNNLNDGILELKSSNFQEIKKLWVITKIHRTIILDKNGNIKKGFANLFDVNFENDLK
jgi:thiol-disulfide isomerase/thioredoxin